MKIRKLTFIHVARKNKKPIMREKALEWWRSMGEQTQREVHSKSIFSKLPFEAFSRSSSKIEMVFKNKDE